MLQNNLLSRNRLSWARGGIFTLLLALSFVCATLAFTGCEHNVNQTFTDDHELNSGLIGTWKMAGDGWSDTYIITDDSVSHPDGFSPYNNAKIEYVYNFNKTSGCIIARYTDGSDTGKYNAVYFKDLSKDSVLLGDAYDTSISYPNDNDSSVATLEEAKQRFSPANASMWGGADAQTGAPLLKQN
jgi:hypothetical protein